MRSRIAMLAAIAALGGFAVLPCAFAQECEDGGGEAAAGDPAVVKQLRVEINALNLINGLHLTVEQVEALLEGARKHQELKASMLGEGDAKQDDETLARARVEALEELKRALEEGRNPDEKTLQALRERLAEKPKPAREGRRPDRTGYGRELRAIEKRIEAMLLDSQREVIATFKPCLIPPKNLKDPVRVGQASDNTREGEVLARLRTLPEEKWKKVAPAILENLLARWEERHGQFPPGEREAELAKARAVAEEARALSEVDFQMRKDELARRVAFKSRKDDLQKEMETLAGDRFDPPGKIASILLDPRILPVLERRLRQMKGFAQGEAVDLEDIEGADTCKNGKCGKKFKD